MKKRMNKPSWLIELFVRAGLIAALAAALLIPTSVNVSGNEAGSFVARVITSADPVSRSDAGVNAAAVREWKRGR